MNVAMFPGQGAQFVGMGKDLYEQSSLAKERFAAANNILGFSITDIMFDGDAEALKKLKSRSQPFFCIRLFPMNWHKNPLQTWLLGILWVNFLP